jgi:hypothetical protein
MSASAYQTIYAEKHSIAFSVSLIPKDGSTKQQSSQSAQPIPRPGSHMLLPCHSPKHFFSLSLMAVV